MKAFDIIKPWSLGTCFFPKKELTEYQMTIILITVAKTDGCSALFLAFGVGATLFPAVDDMSGKDPNRKTSENFSEAKISSKILGESLPRSVPNKL